MPKRTDVISFSDGLCKNVEIIRGEITKDLSDPVPFASQLTGLQRMYWAEQNGFKVDLSICIPYWSPVGREHPYVEVKDFRTGSTAIYRIKKEDDFFGELQPYRRLMLERLMTGFTDRRETDNGQTDEG